MSPTSNFSFLKFLSSHVFYLNSQTFSLVSFPSNFHGGLSQDEISSGPNRFVREFGQCLGRHVRCIGGPQGGVVFPCCRARVAGLHEQIVEQNVAIPVPQIKERVVDSLVLPTKEEIVDGTVPQFQETVEATTAIPQEGISERDAGQIVNMPVFQFQDRIQERVAEQFVDLPVAQSCRRKS